MLFEHPVVTKIAERVKKTPAQVLLRWSTQRGIAVIPKSNNAERLKQNLEVTSFDLEQGELDAISGLDRNLRFNNPTDVSLRVQYALEAANACCSTSAPSTSSLKLENLVAGRSVAFFLTVLRFRR